MTISSAPRADRRFSRLWAGFRVGAQYFERRGLLPAARADDADDASPRGLADHLSDFGNPGLDVARVHPSIAAFFDDPGSLWLHIESRWRGPLALFWRWGLRPVLRLVGQFVLPERSGDIVTRVFAIDRSIDGRNDARGVIRSYACGPDAGVAMQIVSYATWAREGRHDEAATRYMSAAFPLPGGHIAGVLRLDPIAQDPDGHVAVALTSTRRSDDAGVYFLLFGRLPLRLPLGETLALWAAVSPSVPSDLDVSSVPGATLVGRHEQRLCGVRMVTHDYWFRPLSNAEQVATQADRAALQGSGSAPWQRESRAARHHRR